MKRIALEKDIIIYQFEPDEGKFLGLNIVAIFDGDKYILIDTGYEKHMEQVLHFLNKEQCEYVIFSHFHPDHTHGVKLLNHPIKVGSYRHKETLALFEEEEDEDYLPNIEVEENTILHFGRHKFVMNTHPGHSVCIISIILNDKYLFMGDEIMFTNDGESVIPYAAVDLEIHLGGLQKLRVIAPGYTLVPAHGKAVVDETFLLQEIDKRIGYLEYFIKNREATFEAFEQETNIKLIGKIWHQYNV